MAGSGGHIDRHGAGEGSESTSGSAGSRKRE